MKTAKEILTEAGIAGTMWGSQILKAELDGRFTAEARTMASSWATCACGMQDRRLPRSWFNREPLDYKLKRKGFAFMRAVDRGDAVRAAQLLVGIEQRAAQVLAECAS